MRATQTAGRALRMRLGLDWGSLNALQIITNCHKSLQVECIAPPLSNLTVMTTTSNIVFGHGSNSQTATNVALMAMLSSYNHILYTVWQPTASAGGHRPSHRSKVPKRPAVDNGLVGRQIPGWTRTNHSIHMHGCNDLRRHGPQLVIHTF